MKPYAAGLYQQALMLPVSAISYNVTQQLTLLRPTKALLQTEDYAFNLNEFAFDGQAEVTLDSSVLPQVATSFDGGEHRLLQSKENVWQQVRWQGHTLEVVSIRWVDNCRSTERHWILADTLEIAQAFLLTVCEWCSEVRGAVLLFQEGYWQKSAELYQAIQNATFANLILPGNMKQEILDDFTQFFASRALYERHRIPWKRGVLLIGPPGNGKTHTVKALLNALEVPCLYVKSFQSEYANDQRNVRVVFDRARETTPCLLVLEDLDSLVTDQNRSFFLNELDGFAANTGIVVLATTNHPERLDPAIVNRPSRFDRKYHFGLPEATERHHYLHAWSETMEAPLRLTEEVLETTVAATEGFSYAYLKELCLSVMMRWISQSGSASVATVVQEQCAILREQMSSMDTEEVPMLGEDSPFGFAPQQMRRMVARMAKVKM